ncbi:hypothetical protein BDF22DRAFT_692257, partial [Syncephalis plumigaleata]
AETLARETTGTATALPPITMSGVNKRTAAVSAVTSRSTKAELNTTMDGPVHLVLLLPFTTISLGVLPLFVGSSVTQWHFLAHDPQFHHLHLMTNHLLDTPPVVSIHLRWLAVALFLLAVAVILITLELDIRTLEHAITSMANWLDVFFRLAPGTTTSNSSSIVIELPRETRQPRRDNLLMMMNKQMNKQDHRRHSIKRRSIVRSVSVHMDQRPSIVDNYLMANSNRKSNDNNKQSDKDAYLSLLMQQNHLLNKVDWSHQQGSNSIRKEKLSYLNSQDKENEQAISHTSSNTASTTSNTSSIRRSVSVDQMSRRWTSTARRYSLISSGQMTMTSSPIGSPIISNDFICHSPASMDGSRYYASSLDVLDAEDEEETCTTSGGAFLWTWELHTLVAHSTSTSSASSSASSWLNCHEDFFRYWGKISAIDFTTPRCTCDSTVLSTEGGEQWILQFNSSDLGMLASIWGEIILALLGLPHHRMIVFVYKASVINTDQGCTLLTLSTRFKSRDTRRAQRVISLLRRWLGVDASVGIHVVSTPTPTTS